MELTVNGTANIASLVGTHLGWTEWQVIDQDRVDRFAKATDDFQWIHVDPEKAATSQFGGTIAHGYLTLSLVPSLLKQLLLVEGASFGVNYGCNKIRFITPVLTGSQIRLGASIGEVVELKSGYQIVVDVTVEARDATKPAMVAQLLYNYYS
ncbi:MAG: MaoC family dehydratase [Acidimicrobiales bacterium]|jgi:acyl dehydratase|nr:MaoC family dehydratase [Actinomycetota bacterium]